MIRKVVLKGFKRFDEVTFDLPGHVVLAGPNNTGKTTLLQAIAVWSMALERWRAAMGGDYNPRNGFTKVPMTRGMFSAVPLRNFDLLWTDRRYRGAIEIRLELTDGRNITMCIESDSAEQVYVRPKWENSSKDDLRLPPPKVAYVPPMTGLSTDEPVFNRAKIEQLLGQGRPGEVIRNLLVQTHQDQEAWRSLTEVIRRMFQLELDPPDSTGADILAEYRRIEGGWPTGAKLDIACAGSGFQQVLLLMTFLHARPGSVLLVDEPDAHLHVMLQDAIFHELKTVAERDRSQLVIATHSEVIINAVEPTELIVSMGKPKLLASTDEKRALIRSLKVLDNADLMCALVAPGILYLEGNTDLALLREWARILGHARALDLLEARLFWRPTIWEAREGASGIKAKDHYDAIHLIRPDLPGLILLDGDDNPNIPETPLTGQGLQRLRWRRYEIESYLLHPASIKRYVLHVTGSEENAAAAMRYMEENHPPAFLLAPHGDPDYIKATKARTRLMPPILAAGGIDIPYTRWSEIAAQMLPEEVHPEVREKLDGICRAFGVADV